MRVAERLADTGLAAGGESPPSSSREEFHHGC